jgi:hypothetical protein
MNCGNASRLLTLPADNSLSVTPFSADRSLRKHVAA